MPAAVGTAAGTAASGPYGAAAGAALVPTAVDMVIDEIARELEGKKAAPADAATTTAAAISARCWSKLPPVPVSCPPKSSESLPRWPWLVLAWPRSFSSEKRAENVVNLGPCRICLDRWRKGRG